MKSHFLIVSLVVVFLLLSDVASAQTRQRSTDSTRSRRGWRLTTDTTRFRRRLPDSIRTRRWDYALVVTAGGGLSYFANHLGIPSSLEQPRINRFGTPSSLRVMWYPDHRLRVGLETGWTTMYKYQGAVDGERTRVYVSAVPILLVFSMPLAWIRGIERNLVRRMSVTVGTGAYVNHSRLDYAGRVTSSTISPGWMVGTSYTYPIGRRFRVAGELKWFDAVAVKNAAFTAEVQLVWRAFSW